MFQYYGYTGIHYYIRIAGRQTEIILQFFTKLLDENILVFNRIDRTPQILTIMMLFRNVQNFHIDINIIENEILNDLQVNKLKYI